MVQNFSLNSVTFFADCPSLLYDTILSMLCLYLPLTTKSITKNYIKSGTPSNFHSIAFIKMILLYKLIILNHSNRIKVGDILFINICFYL